AATLVSTWPVAGFTQSKVLPLREGANLPPIKAWLRQLKPPKRPFPPPRGSGALIWFSLSSEGRRLAHEKAARKGGCSVRTFLSECHFILDSLTTTCLRTTGA